MIKVGLIGFGYWGPNLARNFNLNSDFNLCAICDFSSDRLNAAGKHYLKLACKLQVFSLSAASPIPNCLRYAQQVIIQSHC